MGKPLKPRRWAQVNERATWALVVLAALDLLCMPGAQTPGVGGSFKSKGSLGMFLEGSVAVPELLLGGMGLSLA